MQNTDSTLRGSKGGATTAFCIAILIAGNILVCFPEIFSFDYLNDDSSLIKGAVVAIKDLGLAHYFYSSYGPNVIRPFQLLAMFAEAQAFGINPLASHLMGFFWFSLAQIIWFLTLSKWTGSLGALIGTLFISFSMLAGEPKYWLSDRHDLFLFFFFACGAYIFCLYEQARQRGRWKQQAGFLLLLLALQWGAFYSNEKGTAIPALLCLYYVIALFVQYGFHIWAIARAAFLPCFLGALNTCAYFALRYSVLGTLVGGYNDTIFPPDVPLSSIFRGLVVGLASIPFRQKNHAAFDTALYVLIPIFCALLVLHILASKRRKSLLRDLCLFLLLSLTVLLSAMPTVQFAWGAVAYGPLNSRMLWLPLIATSAWISICFNQSLLEMPAKLQRGLIALAALMFLGITFRSGKASARNFALAGEITRSRMADFVEYCSCADRDRMQYSGIFMYAGGVNSFTEDAWLKHHVLLRKHPRCSKQTDLQERCYIQFRTVKHNPEAIPVVVSKSRVLAALDEFKEASSISAKKFNVRITRNRNPFEMQLPDHKKARVLRIRAQINLLADHTPVDLIALYVNGEPVSSTTPNVVVGHRKKKRQNLPGRPAFEIILVGEDQPYESVFLRVFKRIGNQSFFFDIPGKDWEINTR